MDNGVTMSWQSKKSLSGAAALMLLGIAALLFGAKWLALLIPLALVVYSSVQHSNGARRRI
jgi:hypothetical protein